jgi:hypothetical protein
MLNSYRLQQPDGMVVAQVIFNRSKSESYYVLLKPSINDDSNVTQIESELLSMESCESKTIDGRIKAEANLFLTRWSRSM